MNSGRNRILPLPKPKKKAEDLEKTDKIIMSGILYLLHNGCQ